MARHATGQVGMSAAGRFSWPFGRREGRRGAQRERVARSPGAAAEATSHAAAALTGRVRAAHLSRGRVKNRPQKAISQLSANWSAWPRQKPASEPDFCSGDRAAAAAGRAQSCHVPATNLAAGQGKSRWTGSTPSR